MHVNQTVSKFIDDALLSAYENIIASLEISHRSSGDVALWFCILLQLVRNLLSSIEFDLMGNETAFGCSPHSLDM